MISMNIESLINNHCAEIIMSRMKLKKELTFCYYIHLTIANYFLIECDEFIIVLKCDFSEET